MYQRLANIKNAVFTKCRDHAFWGLVALAFLIAALVPIVLKQAALSQLFLSPKIKLDNEFLNCLLLKTAQSEDCVRNKIQDWIRLQGTSTVTAELDVYQSRFGSDLKCHLAGHEIGEFLFYQENEDLGATFGMCSTACNSACIHGAVLGFSEVKPLKDFLSLPLEELCAAHVPTGYLQCIHGLGHAYMLVTDYNIQRSIKACEKLNVPTNLQQTCNSGVFMELFGAASGISHETIPEEKYKKDGRPFFPCDEQYVTSDLKAARACLSQDTGLLSTYAYKEGVSIFDLCKEAPVGLTRSCVSAVGLSQAFRTPRNPSLIVGRCRAAKDIEPIKDCLYGAYYMLNFGNADEVDINKFCDMLTPEEQAVCTPYFGLY